VGGASGMNVLFYFLEGIFPYIASAIFVVGTLYRLRQWLKRPVPLRINLAPAKTTWKAVFGKIAAEVLIFISLFRNDKTLWAVAWIMHVCALVILIGSHTYGLVAESASMFTVYTLPLGRTIPYIAALFSFPLVAALLYFIFKRIVSPEVRRITIPTDYFALGLILVHIIGGIYMSFFTHLDLKDAIKWGLGLATFHPYIIPGSWIFAVHCLTGFSLFIYFPFSKLFHPLGQITNRWTMTQKETPLISGGAVVK
jgi:nitrate reductase gamma subunit